MSLSDERTFDTRPSTKANAEMTHAAACRGDDRTVRKVGVDVVRRVPVYASSRGVQYIVLSSDVARYPKTSINLSINLSMEAMEATAGQTFAYESSRASSKNHGVRWLG
jgi:hypothetical protein